MKRRFLISVVGVFLLSLNACMQSTGPTEVAVLVKKISLFGKAGVDDQIYAPGSTYFVMPFFTEWYTFDTKTQTLEMVADRSRGDRRAVDELLFKTIDGNDIGLDVILTYRIIPEKVPVILATVAKSDQELKESLVRTVARSVIRDVFGELRTEEFYIAENRDTKAEQVATRLNDILNKYGVKVERLSTKDYRFNRDYQQAIEDKKVADQKAEKFKSETHATAEEYLKKLEEAKGKVGQIMAKADGEFERSKLEAEAYFDQQSKRAQAIQAEGEAEAKGITEMNKAMASSGGEVMVKLRLAEALAGKTILALPSGGSGMDLKTTNLNRLIDVFGVQKAADTAAQSDQTDP